MLAEIKTMKPSLENTKNLGASFVLALLIGGCATNDTSSSMNFEPAHDPAAMLILPKKLPTPAEMTLNAFKTASCMERRASEIYDYAIDKIHPAMRYDQKAMIIGAASLDVAQAKDQNSLECGIEAADITVINFPFLPIIANPEEKMRFDNDMCDLAITLRNYINGDALSEAINRFENDLYYKKNLPTLKELAA